jgi:hypothetical protein
MPPNRQQYQKPVRKALRRPETNVKRVYSDRHEGWKSHPKPATTTSGSNIPRVETRNPRDIPAKIPFAKLFTHPLVKLGQAVLDPTMTASPEETFYDWSKHGENVSKQIAKNNFVGRDLAARQLPLQEYDVDLPTQPVKNANWIRPEIPEVGWFQRPETGPYISRSPKIGKVEVVIPEYNVPPPIPIELPERHAWFDEVPAQEIPELVKEFDVPPVPQIDIQPVPEGIPDITPEMIPVRKPDQIQERGVSIEIQAVPDKLPIVKFRPIVIKGSVPRKNDTKAHSKWIKLSQLAISLTFGTYTEIMDFVEILVWDAYYIDPRTKRLRYAMFEEEMKMINVLNGIAEGKYSVDIAATLVDYGVSQAQDIIIGKLSRAVTKQVIDTGSWRSPQGPQGFVNKMQKDYKNVLSQYETKSTDDSRRRLLSLPSLSESPRRLWNPHTGLSSSVRS